MITHKGEGSKGEGMFGNDKNFFIGVLQGWIVLRVCLQERSQYIYIYICNTITKDTVQQ